MPTAGTATVDSAGTEIYDDSRGCTTFRVRVTSTSASAALVNVRGLHDNGEFFTVAIGGEELFRLGDNDIKRVFVKGDGGDADVQYGVIART
jgi:hypothetical protein